MTTLAEESDDLVTCAVCLTDFNETKRRPKFLPCAHSVCLSCLKDIKKRSERKMSCPLCRKEFKSPADVATLPNNDAPLHILKLKEKMKRDQELVSKPRWCVTCNSVAKGDCDSAKHMCIDMTAGFMDNLQKLLCLNAELTEKKKQSKVQLAAAVEKKKDVQQYLALVSQSLQSYSANQQSKEKEDEAATKELTSLLLEGMHQLEDDQTHLSDLLHLLNVQEQADCVKKKMDLIFHPIDEKLEAASVSTAQLDRQKKITIKVELLDKGNKSVGCFCIKPLTRWPKDATAFTPHERDSFLLSHLVFELQSQMMKRAKSSSLLSPLAAPFLSSSTPNPSSPTDNSPVARTLTHSFTATSMSSPNQFPNWIASTTLSSNEQMVLVNTQSSLSSSKRTLSSSAIKNPSIPALKHHLSNYRLALEVWNHPSKEPFESFVIIPPPSSHFMPFIKKLTEICHAHPGGLLNRNSITISEVVPGVFILLRFIANTSEFWFGKHLLMQSCDVTKLPDGEDVASALGDIGITLLATDRPNGPLMGWTFLLPLEHYCDPANAHHLKGIPPAFLLGRFSNSCLIEKILSASHVETVSKWKLGMAAFNKN